MTELKSRSIRGGSITMVSQVANTAIQLISTVILARLLAPSDYGILAMVLAVTGFAGLFRDLGLSSAAIQKQDLSDAQQSNLFWLNVAMGTALSIIVAICSPLVARFYGKAELTLITLSLSVTFLIGSLGTQHGARLIRDMKFARQAASGTIGAFIGLIISIAFALAGYSYWSLVWGNIAGSLVTTILLTLFSPFTPCMPSKGSGVRDMLKFGANITAFDLVNYFARNLDNILIGRYWGSGQLGVYSRAYSLLMLPIQAIRGPINAVAFPALSKLQHEPESFKIYYKKVTSIVAFASMPLTAYSFSLSKHIIPLVLGNQWLNVVPIFSILALVSFIQPTLGQIGLVNMSLGMSRRYFMVGAFGAATACIGFFLGIRWGALGVALSYLATRYLFAIPSLMMAFSGTPLKCSDYFKSIANSAISSVLACGICWVIGNLPLGKSNWTYLLLATPAFLLTYFSSFLLLPGGKLELASYSKFLFRLKSAN